MSKQICEISIQKSIFFGVHNAIDNTNSVLTANPIYFCATFLFPVILALSKMHLMPSQVNFLMPQVWIKLRSILIFKMNSVKVLLISKMYSGNRKLFAETGPSSDERGSGTADLIFRHRF